MLFKKREATFNECRGSINNFEKTLKSILRAAFSRFHETFGYYAHGVSPTTAILAAGWEQRLIRLSNPNTDGATGFCLTQTEPTLLEDLRASLESTTLGDPMQPLFWVSKSHAKLAQALRDLFHPEWNCTIKPRPREAAS
jgi:hypothetical protein